MAVGEYFLITANFALWEELPCLFSLTPDPTFCIIVPCPLSSVAVNELWIGICMILEGHSTLEICFLLKENNSRLS